MKLFPLWTILRRLFRSPEQHDPSSQQKQAIVCTKLNDDDVFQLSRRLNHKFQVPSSLMATLGPHLSIRGAEQVATAIGSANLSSLVLASAEHDNDNSNKMLQVVYRGIQRSETLHQLKIRLVGNSNGRHDLDLSQLPPSLQSLRLFFSDYASGPAIWTLQSLSRGVCRTTSLNTLEFGNLNVGDADDSKVMNLVSHCLAANSSVTSLTLQGSLRDSHVEYFVERGWQSDAPLQQLGLDSIYITIVGMQKLLKATLTHPTLQSLTLNLMFSTQQDLFDAMQMMVSVLPQLRLRQLRVDLSLCGEGVDQPLPEKVQNETFYALIRQVQRNRYLSQIRVSGWNMQQPQEPMFDLRFGI